MRYIKEGRRCTFLSIGSYTCTYMDIGLDICVYILCE